MIHDPAAASAKLRANRAAAATMFWASGVLLLGGVDAARASGAPATASPSPRGSAVASAAPAGAAPLIDPADRAAATRLQVDANLAPPAAAPPVEAPTDEGPSPRAASWSATAHTRFVTLPSFVLDAIYADHPSFRSVSAGAAVEYGDPRSASWVIELDWTRVGLAGANWRENGVPPGASTYADVGLHLLSVDASYRWAFRLGGPVDVLVGLGLGLGGLIGDIHTAEVLPNCVEPIDQCPHWRSASHATVDLPTRVVPVVHVAFGLQAALGEDGLMRLMVGFRDSLYAGLTVGLRL